MNPTAVLTHHLLLLLAVLACMEADGCDMPTAPAAPASIEPGEAQEAMQIAADASFAAADAGNCNAVVRCQLALISLSKFHDARAIALKTGRPFLPSSYVIADPENPRTERSMLRPFQNAWELWQSAWQPPVEQRAVRDRQRLRDSRNRLIDALLAHPAIALHALVGETADHLDVLNRLIDDDDAIAPPVAYVAAQEAYAFGVAMQLASVRDGFVRERCDLRMAAALWRELQELDRTGLPRLEDADR
ncbi:MAG: hypothetical protein AB7S36_11850, partial [Planctomycetota bacterium]